MNRYRIKNIKFLVLTMVLVFFLNCKKTNDSIVIMNVEGFPTLVELNPGETYTYRSKSDSSNIDITLLDYKLYKEDNYWFDRKLGQKNYYKAKVNIRVNSKDTVLLSRAYQMPTDIGGLSIGVEAVKEWDDSGNLEAVNLDLQKKVRLAISKTGKPHAPLSIRFPIVNYLWRSSSYYNTWNSLVPYNLVYYHRGEDMAAIPDRLSVISLMDGIVEKTPLPNGDGKSNGFIVKGRNGVKYRYGHINTESFMPGLDRGLTVKAGQKIGLTGETWNGSKRQHNDPHLHTEFRYGNTKFNIFPALMEAYFRDYKDELVAIAGGYRFIKVGDSVELDATRSLARPGKKVVSYQWITHTGDTINTAKIFLTMKNPGLYSEQLIATTGSGEIDRDFLQVRVYGQESVENMVRGNVMYTPVREIKPKDSVLFWSRFVNTGFPVNIDFGDGSPAQEINDEIYHQYEAPGNYVVSYITTGPNKEPTKIQIEVKVKD